MNAYLGVMPALRARLQSVTDQIEYYHFLFQYNIMLTYFFIYLLCGAIIGFLAGLFGIGGGLLIIPALLELFKLQNMPDTMHLAIGTSMASIAVASISSVIAQYARRNILFNIVKICVPGSIIGCLAGVMIASRLHGIYLQSIFGALLFAVALQMFFKKHSAEEHTDHQIHHKKIMLFASTVIGILSGMLGIGGGVFIIPFFQWCGISIRHSIGTAAACILPVSIIGTIGFMISGAHLANLPSYSTGYLYWPAFIGISITSALLAPTGVKAAHAISTTSLRKLFAVFILLIAIKLLF